jgi:ATP-dependent exoDNAse (exonuclease V) beta subunit
MRALTDEQEQAVARRAEPLLLAAGAGSGKTSVLVERFVRAVLEDGVAPGKILAITFTERAAGELRERVRKRFLELGERAAARDTEAAFVSTFHGFCARLLRAHSLPAGLDPEFEILDEGLAGRMRAQAFRVALRDFLGGERSEAVDLVAAYGADRVRAMVEGSYAELRSRGRRRPALPVPAHPEPMPSEPMSPESVPDGGPDDADDADGAQACALLGELLEGFGSAYEALKRGRGAVDFDDLELRARELLDEHEGVRAAWSERFELLMVDEFQDTNPRQLAILTVLERGNLFTVGDELQSIYGFRHADVGLFRARRAELGERGGSLELTHNFRSRPPLLDVVNAVFEDRFAAGYTPLVAGREDARERGGRDACDDGGGDAREDGRGDACEEGGDDAHENGGEPLVELLLTSRRGWDDDEELAAEITGGQMVTSLAPRWRHAEARMLAQRVADLVESGEAKAGEVVVLLRAVGDLEVYERALQERGLRTLAAVGGFWGRQQVGDLLMYLRALANPLDELAVYATLASPLVGCSSDGLALLARAAHGAKRGVWEMTGHVDLLDRLPVGDRTALAAFRDRFEAERRTASRRTISQLIERAVDAAGYREHVLGLEWGERRLANVHKLLRLARRFEASEGRDLRGFLDYVAHQEDRMNGAVAEPDAPVAGVEPDAVGLMSIHAAKGLEFPVVCVADLGRALNMSVPDLLVDGDRIGLRLVRLDGEEARSSLDFDLLCEERKRAQAEEEERILYVAMTRARERLLLSGAVDFERWPEQRRGAPTISWLGPALAADLPAIALALEQPVCDLAVGASGDARVRLRLNAPTQPFGLCAPVGTVLRRESLSPARRSGALRSAAADVPVADVLVGDVPVADVPVGDVPVADVPASPAVAPATQKQANGRSSPPGPLATLSYTALAELERCGYRYYLERVLGLPENRAAARTQSSRAGMEARARGTLVHKLLESVDFARPSAPSWQEVARVGRELLGARMEQGECEEIAALVGAASGGALAERIAAAESVRSEHPFAFSSGPDEPLITGVIDLLAREADGGRLVVDYKSDRVGAEEDLEALIEREYGTQRLLYALAVLRDGAPRVEVVHWFLQRPREWVGARYTAEDRGELEGRLAGFVQRARTRTFSVSQSPHRGLCLTCPGRAGMCSWSDAETMSEAPGS